MWAVVVWQVVKGLGLLVFLAVRFWRVTIPAAVVAMLWVEYGWPGPVVPVLVVVVLLTVWWFAHRASFLAFAWFPVLARWRRVGYKRRWFPAMATAKLTVTFDGHTVVPILRRVTTNGTADILTVRMVTGQIPDDYAKVAERLTHTFGARSCRVAPGSGPDLVVLTFQRTDPLAQIVAPLPVPSVPDFTALPVAKREDGQTYHLRLFGTQVLVVGATGAGKGSVLAAILRALAAGIASGVVRVWAFDPKGGMELAPARRLFARFACDDFEQMADLLDEAVRVMRDRTQRLRGRTRQHVPTVDDPLYVLVIDELAALTAYLSDRKLKDRIKAALGVLLTQGRAVGVHVVAALQDPRKEVLPFRDLFPTRIGLRLSEEPQVDLVLGEGMRDRGALCDRIPQTTPGTAYVVLEGDPTPMRVRFPYMDDNAIRDMADTYGQYRVIDADTTAVAEGGEAA